MKKLLLFLALSMLAVAPAQGSIIVGTKLSLVIDVSGSVDTSEYNLMMDGYRDAFLDSQVQTNILSQANGIAVNVVFFSTNPTTSNAWVHLNSVASINAFANYLDTVARPTLGDVGNLTGIARGMNQGIADLLNTTAYSSSRLVMDVSGDGIENVDGTPAVIAARNAAAANGIRVNGLTIDGNVGGLLAFYNNNVRTADGFVLNADSFSDFRDAVRQKIFFETQAVPEPGSALVWLVGVSLLGAHSIRRRRLV